MEASSGTGRINRFSQSASIAVANISEEINEGKCTRGMSSKKN